MEDEQEERERLKGRRKSISAAMQNCWFGIIVTSFFDAVFHFRFGEPWLFIPMMFFLAVLVPLVGYCYVALGMVNARLKALPGEDRADRP